MKNNPYPELQIPNAVATNDIRQKLINLFVEDSQGKYEEIMEGIKTGDIRLAHRLAHTLKSNAGLLELTALQKAAEDVEHQLKNGAGSIAPEQAAALKTELDAALSRLTPLVCMPAASEGEPLAREEALELLNKIELMLEDFDTECMTFLDELRLIPGSRILVKQIEEFSFDAALSTVLKLKDQIMAD